MRTEDIKLYQEPLHPHSDISCKESKSDTAQLSPKLLARPAVFVQLELSGVLLGVHTSRVRTGGLWPLQRPMAHEEGGLLLSAPSTQSTRLAIGSLTITPGASSQHSWEERVFYSLGRDQNSEPIRLIKLIA